MEEFVKHFSELTTDELLDIVRLRISVFVVEQNCPYQEVDTYDQDAYHVYFKAESKIIAYARVYRADGKVRIGRVISVMRRCGIGIKIVSAAVEVAKKMLDAKQINIEAQVYARGLYEKVGFYQTSDVFLEDGIPHICMELKV